MPARRDVSLVDLPVDVFDLITRPLDGQSILHLWIVGNKDLCNILGPFKGVKRLQLVSKCLFGKSWPKIIREFRGLRHLDVRYLSAPIDSPTLIWKQISQLGDLETLKLEFPECEACFFKLPPNLEKLFRFKSTLPTSLPDLITLNDIEGSFPKLVTLKLNGQGYLKDEHLSKFPKTLKSLKLGSTACLTTGCLKDLPPYLTCLVIPTPIRVTSPMVFPPSLVRLEIPACLWKVEELAKSVPPTLTRFKVHDLFWYYSNEVEWLPTSIKCLEASRGFIVPPERFSFLPKNLTSIVLSQAAYATLSDQDIALLPSTLTSLTLNRFRISDSTLQAMQAADFDMESVIPTQKRLIHFPASLTSFEAHSGPTNLEAKYLLHFPDLLELKM